MLLKSMLVNIYVAALFGEGVKKISVTSSSKNTACFETLLRVQAILRQWNPVLNRQAQANK